MDDGISNTDPKISGKNQSGSSDEQQFSASFLASFSPFESKKLINIINQFIVDFASKMTTFIGKKIDIEFNSMQVSQINNFSEKEGVKFANFRIDQFLQEGFLVIENKILNPIINILFGYDEQESMDGIVQLGKFSNIIAKKIIEIMLDSLKTVVNEVTAFEPTLVKISDDIKAFNSQNFPDKFYQIVFRITCFNCHCPIYIFLPELFIEKMTYDKKIEEPALSANEAASVNNRLKKELIDTTVVLTAVLPSIKIKLQDVVKLKPGDLIPIDDPTQVELMLAHKKAYKALVGQAQERRVVKVMETVAVVQDLI